MSIIQKVKAVEQLYTRLDSDINNFRENSGVFCFSGCGKCCTKPDIEASPLEFLPLAFHWFKQGMAHEMLDKLQSENSSICILYHPLSLTDSTKGSCGNYPYRGLICRLFGYGAGKDKYGKLRLVTCKLIKEGQVENYAKAVEMLKRNEQVPIFSDYYTHLMQIDFRLANQMLPINEAIEAALEAVLQYYAYRPFPKQGKVA
ncbi:YkgJ family cysteine cluster protein [Marivirga sp. S37H4]|uniref:YkgJ family cysteine cluster protein n=1 Tax=Marivirga aurantiaca TaxID=2802615 RepID=A0A935CBZ6_9BACT|nr:YkgJ family cysteine cluster protein [Marivirga aurantiaca]MBK6267369.1 YkgJ family cysteine cluster protein [Marivirga aurantiaca]